MENQIFIVVFLSLAILGGSSRISGKDDHHFQSSLEQFQQSDDLLSKLPSTCGNNQDVELGYESVAKIEAMIDTVKEQINSASGLSKRLINETLERNGNKMDRLLTKIDAVGYVCNKAVETKGAIKHQQEQLDCSAIDSLVSTVQSLKDDMVSIGNSFTYFEKSISSELNSFTKGLKAVAPKSQCSRQYPEFPCRDYCPTALEDGVYCFKWNDNCYCLSAIKKSWTGAFAACRKYNMNLLSIETAKENEEITRVLRRMHFNEPVWTSGSHLMNEGNWIWTSTNQPITYFNWHPGQPDNANSIELFLHINFFDRNGKWNNIPGTNLYAFICELE